MTAPVALPDDVLLELCGVEPGGFVAARDAHVKNHKANKELAAAIKALKKPSVQLWALNALARAHPSQANAWLAVGTRLTSAQADALRPDGAAALRDATRAQKELLTTLLGLTLELLEKAGQSSAVVDKVRPLLLALHPTTPTLAAAFARGTLLVEPEPTDLSDVLTLMAANGGAPAVSPSPRAAEDVTDLAAHRVAARDRAEQEAAERAAQQAARAARLAQLDERIAGAVKARQQAQQSVAAAQQAYDNAEEALHKAQAAAREAQQALASQKAALTQADQALQALQEERTRV